MIKRLIQNLLLPILVDMTFINLVKIVKNSTSDNEQAEKRRVFRKS